MKRILTAILVCALAAALLVLPAMAIDADSSIQLSDDYGAAGDTVEVIYSISGFPEVTTLGLKFNIPEGLKLESAEWLLKADLEDVNEEEGRAGWAVQNPKDMSEKTDVFKLTFTVLESGADLEKELEITAIVKKYSEKMGETTATAKILPAKVATGMELQSSLQLDLHGNASAKLTATITPADATDSVLWSCDDSGVVSVAADGTVTALKKGTATVTATARSISKSCVVTVVCSHDLEETKAKTPTCTEIGNNQYYTCKVCDAVLAADKTTETTVEAQKLAMVEHELEETKAKAPTCTEIGNNRYYTCKDCGVVLAADKATVTTVEAQKLAMVEHDLEETKAKAPTCTEIGNNRYYTCKDCGVVLAADKATVTTVEAQKLAMVEHDLEETKAKAPTCTEIGNNQYYTCKDCGVVLAADKATVTTVEAQKLAMVEHDLEETKAKTPTCTEIGNNQYYTCKDCGVVLAADKATVTTVEAQKLAMVEHTGAEAWTSDDTNHWHVCTVCQSAKVDVSAHSFTWVVDKEPTEEAEGAKHQVCTGCGKTANEGTAIEKLAHTYVRVEGIAPTCTENGVVEHYACQGCGKYFASVNGSAGHEITAEETVLAAAGHTFGEEWYTDSENHWHICHCGKAQDPQKHTVEIVGAIEATETEDGYTGDHTCTVCGSVIQEGQSIPSLGTDEPEVTEPSTNPSETEPEENDDNKEELKGKLGSVLVVLIVALTGVCGAIAFLLVKKKKIVK